jgi:hypothetical protein
MTTTKPRPWRSNEHLRDLITSDAGAFTVQPLRADDVHFDVAWSNYYPGEQGQHGSTPLDIGRGVKIRATGNARKFEDAWMISGRHFNGEQVGGRELTSMQRARAIGLLEDLIAGWAATHEGDLAQADDIDRNNSANRLETQIGRHEEALAILRAQLVACEEGEPFSMYPDLPTDR